MAGEVQFVPCQSLVGEEIFLEFSTDNLIMNLFSTCESGVTDETRRTHYRQKISDYMARAEKIKEHVEQEKEGEWGRGEGWGVEQKMQSKGLRQSV